MNLFTEIGTDVMKVCHTHHLWRYNADDAIEHVYMQKCHVYYCYIISSGDIQNNEMLNRDFMTFEAQIPIQHK